MNYRLLFCFALVVSQLGFSEDFSGLTGKVVLPKSAEYGEARLVSNYYPSKNKFPKAIVYCQNAQDVQNAVKWAVANKVPIRIRSGGHNHEGFSTGSDVLIIDVSQMKQLRVDKSINVAVVQPGITGGELYKKLYAEGLTQVGGTCSDVGISGLVLTGGMGPLLRKYGLTCDNVLYFELVNARGDLIRITKDNEYKDLFWALRGGGGGNFGVVTSVALKVYPATPVTWFNIGWDWEQPVEKVLATWQELFSTGDRKWFSHLDIWAKVFPKDQFNKLPVKALGVYWGTPEEAKKDLAPLLVIGKPSDQTIERVNWDKAIHLFEEATSVFVTDKPEYKSTGTYANDILPPEANKTIVSTLQKSDAPLLNVLLFSMGGASSDISPTDSAYFYRKAKFFVCYSSQWLEASKDAKQTKEIDVLRETLLSHTVGDYIGNPDRNLKDYLSAYFGDNVRRLRCVKRKYDPENVFQFEQGIPPAPKDWDCEVKA